jgi:DNA primase
MMATAKRRRRERRPSDPAAAEAARNERLEALHQQLEQGVAAIRDGDAWKAWLAAASKFHRYSFNNQILIAVQNPEATLVAGYGAWQAMGRQVRKGEKAMWVLAPVTARAAEADDEQEGSAEHEQSGSSRDAAKPRRRVVGFRPAAVFDVAQTDGDPLPAQPRAQLLEGEAPQGLWDALAGEVAARGFQLGRCPDAAAIRGANGVTDFADRTVLVRADVSDAQAVKTLAHEAAHVAMHDPRGGEGSGGDGPDCRGLIEVEAESVAYLVAAHHGMDTAGYSFAYVAQWAGRDDEAIAATAARVLSTARALIGATDPADGAVPSGRAAELAEQVRSAAGAARDAARHAEATRDRAAAVAAGRDSGDRLRTVLAGAQAWFLEQAAGSDAFAAAAAARGHTVPAVVGYGAGYAPPGWTGLVDHLRAAGHRDRDILDAGVAGTTRTGRLIDRFRGRVTFPVHDHRGVVGFTARDTTGNPDTPKYLNTPATDLYAKARVLFGTQHLDPQHTRTVVLVEGPWDALAVTAGGGGAIGVAACGTAVTDHHLDLLRSEARTLVLAPDADPAGTAAMGRTLAMLAERGAPHPMAATTPAGTDLADLYAAGGAAAVRSTLVEARVAGIAYAEAYLTADPPRESAEARVAASRAAAAFTPELSGMQREGLAKVLVGRGGIGEATARAIIDTIDQRAVTLPKVASGAVARAPVATERRQPSAAAAL